jgi:septum formation protein
MYQKIILASGSPRRRELFSKLRVNFQYVTSEINEEFNTNVPITDEVMRIAAMKAYNVSNIYDEAMIIGADTVVVLDGKVFGKPKNREDAINTLKELSGKTHEVITGVAVINKKEKICERFYDITKVTFKKLSDELIEWYIDKEEPYDKAGSYAIQDTGAILVSKIEGDFNNVVGLPISKIFDTFGKMEFMPYGGLHAIS